MQSQPLTPLPCYRYPNFSRERAHGTPRKMQGFAHVFRKILQCSSAVSDPCKSVSSVLSAVRFGFFGPVVSRVCAQPLFLINLVVIAQMNSAPAQPAQALPSTGPRAPRWTAKRTLFLVLLLAFLLFARFAGSLLVRDHPEKSDVIVVL